MGVNGDSAPMYSLHTFRCVLSGVQDLHNANYGHTDIRWQNIIQCGHSYRLIDLEFVCKLNQRPFTPPGQHSPQHPSFCQQFHGKE